LGNFEKEAQVLKYTQFRYCPKCGQDALQQFGENGFICELCGLKYFQNTASATGGIIKTPKGIIITERANDPSRGLLDLPGGFTNYNETLEDALTREVKEELGISIDSLTYLASFPNVYKYAKITYFTTDVFFTAHWDCSSEPVLSDEIARYFYVDPQQINLEQFAFESTKKAVQKFLTEEHGR
jgi:ADP-ribose pyrophosphatase YjhB (NUDIX family)